MPVAWDLRYHPWHWTHINWWELEICKPTFCRRKNFCRNLNLRPDVATFWENRLYNELCKDQRLIISTLDLKMSTLVYFWVICTMSSMWILTEQTNAATPITMLFIIVVEHLQTHANRVRPRVVETELRRTSFQSAAERRHHVCHSWRRVRHR